MNDVLRVHGDTHAYPLGISIGPRHVLLSSWFSMTVEKVDRKTGKLVASLGRLRRARRCARDGRRHALCRRAGERQPREGQRRRQDAQHRGQGAARSGGAGAGAGQRDLRHRDRRRRGEPDRRRLGRAQGRGRRAGRPRRHRCRARRPALRRRGRPEARGRDRSGDRRQDGDRLQPRYRPGALSRRAAGAGADRRRGRQDRRGLCQLRPPQRDLQAHARPRRKERSCPAFRSSRTSSSTTARRWR